MAQININIPEDAQSIMRHVESRGHQIHIVGGACRDAVMGIANPHDIDMATSATPEQIVKMFADWNCIPTGEQHGTYTIMVNGVGFEITAFRAEFDYDGRRPQRVEYGVTIEQDAGRRDFTINCIYVDIRGSVYDPHNGIADIHAGIVRCAGNANHRFWEDHHRMMRAIRFASRYGFWIETATGDAIIENAYTIADISGERIWSEFVRIVMECPYIAENETYINAVMGHVIPNVHRTDWYRIVAAPESIVARVGMVMAYAGVDGQDVRPIMRSRMACTNAIIRSVEAIVEWHNKDYNCRTDVRRAMHVVGYEFAHVANAIHGMYRNTIPTIQYNRIRYNEDCVSFSQMAVGGEDVMSMGFSGRAIGQAQERIIQAIMADEIANDRDTIMARDWS